MRREIIGFWALLLFTFVGNSVAGAQQPREGVAELGDVIAPHVLPVQNLEKEIAGLSSDSRPEVLNWERIYALALVRTRSHRESSLQLLDPAALAEEAARQGVADFARFRTDFRTTPMFRDPGPAVLELQRRLLAIDSARRTVAALESLSRMFVARSQGGSSGLNRIDIDKVFASSARARQKLTDSTRQFRDGLDAFKISLGLSPHAAVIIDRQSLQGFPTVFEAVENWARRPTRRAEDLYRLIDGLPVCGEVVINGEPVFDTMPDQWAEVVAKAARLAEKVRDEQKNGPAPPDLGVQLELRARRQIRGLDEKRHAYQEEKKCYELAIRLRDQTFERLLAPPPAVAASRSGLVVGLLEQLIQVRETQDRLIELWTSFRAERLVLYHDMGVLPYTDWKTFYADLATGPVPGALAPAVRPEPAAGR
jgi:hypothetical protein